jgi:hypothetical protein
MPTAGAKSLDETQGACDYIEADVRDPGTIVSGAARRLNLAEPVAIMMLGS